MNKWTWTAILLAFFNMLLLITYFNKRERVNSVFAEIKAEPGVEVYQEISQKIAQAYPSRFYELGSTSEEFGKASQILNDAISLISIRDFDGNASDFFSKASPVNQGLQDSLWTAFRDYRSAADKVLDVVIPRRRDFYQRYIRAVEIDRELAVPVSAQRKKQLQGSLDTLSRFTEATYKIDIDDQKRLKEFISSLEWRSSPGAELKMNNLLMKIDSFFPAKGKVMMYGKIYALSELTQEDRVLVFHFGVMIKSATDEQLFNMPKLNR